ncbi:MAG: hypothetical protein AABX70_07000 [Nanoarchaeota archaeon]
MKGDFSRQETREMGQVVRNFRSLPHLYQFYARTGQKSKLGKALADKALFLIPQLHEVEGKPVEMALSARETQTYLREPGRLERFAKQAADLAAVSIRYGQFHDGHYYYEALSVLKGKRFHKQVTSRLDHSSAAFKIMQDDIVYSAVNTFLHWGNHSDVSELLHHPSLRPFLSAERTQKTLDAVVEDKLQDLAFEKLDDLMQADEPILPADLREKIKRRKAVAEGREQPKDGEVQPRIPLSGMTYTPTENQRFREEVDYGLDLTIKQHTEYSWWDLMKNEELHTYLNDPHNLEDFCLKIAQAMQESIAQVRKQPMRKDYKRTARGTFVRLNRQRMGMHLGEEHFHELAKKLPIYSEAFLALKTIVKQRILDELEDHSLFTDPVKNILEKEGGSIYVTSEEVVELHRAHLQHLIQEGKPKKLFETCLGERDFALYIPREKVTSALRAGVQDGYLTQTQYDQVFAYERKRKEKWDKEKKQISPDMSLEQKVRLEVSQFVRQFNHYHPHDDVNQAMKLPYDLETRREILRKGFYAAIAKDAQGGNLSDLSMTLGYLLKGKVSDTMPSGQNSTQRTRNIEESARTMNCVFGSTSPKPFDLKRIGRYLTVYFRQATQKGKGEEALERLYQFQQDPVLKDLVPRNEITQPYFNLIQLYKFKKAA